MFLFIVTYIGLFFYVYNICLYITILWFDDTASVYNIFLISSFISTGAALRAHAQTHQQQLG